jgi:hypothetical protein
MTINDEFFKKTQENLKKIKQQDNQYTLKKYNIKDEAEELPSTQPVKTEPTEPTEPTDNVVSLDAFRNKKQVAKQPKSTKISTEERMKRVAESINRINDLMSQLEKNNRKQP